MTDTLLPTDGDNNPIPALTLRDGGAHAIAVTSTAARNATAFDGDTLVVSIYATVPVYLKMGDVTVEATDSDHYFPAGVYYDIALGNEKTGIDTHISVLAFGDDGTLYISEKG